jgi:SAM-dependent methyltransferase
VGKNPRRIRIMSSLPQLPLTRIDETPSKRFTGDGGQSPLLSNAIRLNLGCEDKILVGYINIGDRQKGEKKPDLLADITNLHMFADSSVDEIITIHVLQKFYFWQMPAVLQEWRRVLKPGGRLIIETGNLLHACAEIMRHPFNGALPSSQTTMFALYGNPAEQDEKMTNRWCFTPQTLTQILLDMGFDEIRQEAAQFKLREPRDMRVVCVKPRG